MVFEDALQLSECYIFAFLDSETTFSGRSCFRVAVVRSWGSMLPLLTLASAEICWQLKVDVWMAAQLEVGCLSPVISFNHDKKAGEYLQQQMRNVSQPPVISQDPWNSGLYCKSSSRVIVLFLFIQFGAGLYKSVLELDN